jgi:hypothetical protein
MYRGGRGPRGLLFLALDERGDAHLAVAEQTTDVASLKIGNKLSLPWPFPGRIFYIDAVHPVGSDAAVVNGDRRIGNVSTFVDVAALVSGFVRQADAQSVFFGCTPHQPGSWWVEGEHATPLHDRGLVDIVPVPAGLLARRTVDDGLYFLALRASTASRLGEWQRVFDAPFGNVLMLERRALGGRLVLSCQGGLVEVDIGRLPEVRETGRIASTAGYAVVGRITNGAFAVTSGAPRDWGLDELRPATLVGSRGCSFTELGKLLDEEGGPTAVLNPDRGA